MRLTPSKMAVLVGVGALLTIAVAWACALWVPLGVERDHAPGPLAWSRPVPADWPSSPLSRMEARRFGRHSVLEDATDQRSVLRWLENDPESNGAQRVPVFASWVDRSGWPWKALECQILPGKIHSGIGVPYWMANQMGDDAVLPLRVLWPGFALNTVFYACIAWVLAAAPSSLRRWLRVRRGRCQACGYDRQGITAVCPECGARSNG